MPVISVNGGHHVAGADSQVWTVNPNVRIDAFSNTQIYENIELDNWGAIVSTYLAAVNTSGDFSVVHNRSSALIYATDGLAVRVFGGAGYGRSQTVLNDGDIISPNANAVVFDGLRVLGALVNTGMISSHTKAAVTVLNGTLFSIRNSGDLFGYEAIALTGFSTKTQITNTGRIEADVYAIRTQDGNTFSLNNSGVVDGVISARTLNGADSATNSGRMLKNVVLGPGNDTYTGTGSGYAYRVYGEEGVDRLTGSAAADTFYGGSENDVLNGGGGNDWLMGQTGVDRLTGGAGNDVFVFAYMPSATTRGIISDFNVGNDTIHLENAIFSKVGAAGALKAGAFALSTATKAADDRIIYNKATGQLFYDSDGSGTAAAIHFATLQNKPTVTAADFQVI